MTDPQQPSAGSGAPAPAPDARPAYEPPRITRKKPVSRATLFTGRGGPTAPVPLVANG